MGFVPKTFWQGASIPGVPSRRSKIPRSRERKLIPSPFLDGNRESAANFSNRIAVFLFLFHVNHSQGHGGDMAVLKIDGGPFGLVPMVHDESGIKKGPRGFPRGLA